MIKINLLPEEIQRRAEVPPFYLFFIPPLLALCVSGFFFYQVTSQLKAVEKEIKQVEQELAKYKDVQQELAQVKEELSKVEARITFISSARAKQSFWREALVSFANILPPNMVLNTLTIGPSGEMSFDAQTDRFSSVANFMRTLNASVMFTDAKLSAVSKGYDASGQEAGLTSFQMTVFFIPESERKKLKLEKKTGA